jgi:hypothetical protein
METTAAALVEIPRDMIWLLWLYVLIIVLVAVLPRLIEVIVLYSMQYKIRKRLIDKAAANGLTVDELKSLLAEVKGPLSTVVGTARTPIALTVIVILGIAIAHLLVRGESGDIINNILSMLAGLLAAITGFYFGGRQAEAESKKAEEKEKDNKNNLPGGKPNPPPKPTDKPNEQPGA